MGATITKHQKSPARPERTTAHSAKTESTPPIDEAKYGRLLGRLRPHPIKTEEDNERLTDLLLKLDEKGDLTPEEALAYELIATLIEQYEETHYPMLGATPPERLKKLMLENRLVPKDLYVVLGSSARTSEILSGKRNISKAQAKKLADLFEVSPILFI